MSHPALMVPAALWVSEPVQEPPPCGRALGAMSYPHLLLPAQGISVLVVCVHVLELLLYDAAMPRGTQVRALWEWVEEPEGVFAASHPLCPVLVSAGPGVSLGLSWWLGWKCWRGSFWEVAGLTATCIGMCWESCPNPPPPVLSHRTHPWVRSPSPSLAPLALPSRSFSSCILG